MKISWYLFNIVCGGGGGIITFCFYNKLFQLPIYFVRDCVYDDTIHWLWNHQLWTWKRINYMVEGIYCNQVNSAMILYRKLNLKIWHQLDTVDYTTLQCDVWKACCKYSILFANGVLILVRLRPVHIDTLFAMNVYWLFLQISIHVYAVRVKQL